MNVTTRIIQKLVLGACLCAACQQSEALPPASATHPPANSTPPPASPIPTRTPTDATQLDPDTEEYVVYAALIDGLFIGEYTKQVLIVDHTRIVNLGLLEQHLEAFQEYKQLDSRLVYNFLARNREPYPLKPDLYIKYKYVLFTQEEVDELGKKDEESGWKLLYELYPNSVGFIYLSRGGFNADLNQALVYYQQYHYEQPIQGGYYLMIRQEGKWVVENGYEWMT